MDTSRFVTLGKIAAEAQALSGKPKSKVHLFFQMITNGLRDLQLYHHKAPKRVILAMSESYTVDLPDDFLSFIAIGIPISGKLHLFTEDNELLAITTVEDVYDWTDSIDEKSLSGPGARGGKNSDYFKIDWENSRIVFNSPSVRAEIILEYVSSGIDASAETSIPVTMKMILISYALWQDGIFDTKTPYTQVGILKERYENEVEKLRMLELPGIDSIRDEIRRSYRMSPKR